MLIEQKHSTWRPCIIVAHRRKDKCFPTFCLFHLCIRPFLLCITNWVSFLIQRPLPVLPDSADGAHTPTLEPEPFLYILGKQRMLEAQHRCYDRMQKLPPYQGEGKKKDVCECVFQTFSKGIFSSVGKYVLTHFNLICQ